MSDRRDQTIDQAVLAVLLPTAEVEGGFRALVVRATSTGPVLLAAEHSVPDNGLSATLAEHSCARILVILPGGATLCPGIPLPTEDETSAISAAALQREMLIAQGIPSYRVAVASAQSIRTRAGRLALATTWLDDAKSLALAHRLATAIAPSRRAKRAAGPDVHVRYLAPAALAFAAVDLAAREADSPALALWVEEIAHADSGEEGLAASVTLAGGGLAASRSTRLSADGAESLSRLLRQFVAETATMAGWPDATTEAAASAIEAIPDGMHSTLHGVGFSIRRLLRVEGAPEDHGWWHDFGALAVAASIASAEPDTNAPKDGTIASLATLEPTAPRVKRSVFTTAIYALQNPRRAWQAAGAALLVVALAPMALAGARLLVLEQACGDPAAIRDRVIDAERRLAMYRDADKHAWSMSKLLADLSAVTPEAIEIEQVRLTQGGDLTVRGKAKPAGSSTGADAILAMERLMYASRVFDRVTKDWDPTDARGLTKFVLNATVARPSLIPPYPVEQDFAAKSMRERRYGPAEDDAATGTRADTVGATAGSATIADGAAGGETVVSGEPVKPSDLTPADGASSDDAGASSTRSSGSASGARERGLSGGSGADGVARRGAPVTRSSGSEDEIPPALTSAEVDAMTLSEAQAALPRYATARNINGVDDETKARLRADFDLLLAQIKKLKQAP